MWEYDLCEYFCERDNSDIYWSYAQWRVKQWHFNEGHFIFIVVFLFLILQLLFLFINLYFFQQKRSYNGRLKLVGLQHRLWKNPFVMQNYSKDMVAITKVSFCMLLGSSYTKSEKSNLKMLSISFMRVLDYA